ncbi:hypothetical protein Dsin_010563 [Dipteronia sinensis]|uniref:TF-B3 domain-containing protein n=1 Tax=Dipteronia sinensis TaxID=43782 RepID=A0AAE0ECP6_9ROSI|nr:hypothetical protein Dsin_010563 [Dipteronia sinensis]
MPPFKFSKNLIKSDIDKLALPEQTVEHMIPMMNGQNSMDLKVVDSRSQEWELRYYTRPNGKKKSPVFTKGWREFVQDKRLRVGDEFTFYGHQVRAGDGQLKMEYMFEVKRPSSMTFDGVPLTSDVEYLANGAEPVTVVVEGSESEFQRVNATLIFTFQGQPIIDN